MEVAQEWTPGFLRYGRPCTSVQVTLEFLLEALMAQTKDATKVEQIGRVVSSYGPLITFLGGIVGPIASAVLNRSVVGVTPTSSSAHGATDQSYDLLELVCFSLLVSSGAWLWWQRRTLSRKLQEAIQKDSRRIRMIGPEEYSSIVRDLTKKQGPGHLLLFNIELNTFSDPSQLSDLWGPLTLIPELKSVRLALPPAKFKRWEKIVTGVGEKFFQDGLRSEKFVACQYDPERLSGEDRIAFALYEPLNSSKSEDWATIFLLNRPFVVTRGDAVFDYLHILEYFGTHDVIVKCRDLWEKVYDDNWAETASEIQEFARERLTPPTLDALIKKHHCDRERENLLRRVVGARRIVDETEQARNPCPSKISSSEPLEDRQHKFTLTYRYAPPHWPEVDRITGTCTGISPNANEKSLPCIIWATGFGDGDRPRLAQRLSEHMKLEKGKIVEVYFTKSGIVEETTCSRFQEDIAAVLDYVCHIPAIDPNRVYLVGISLSGYLATKVAAVDDRVKGLVLVAPPIDVVEMLDTMRRLRLPTNVRIPCFDDFLKARNNLRIADWDRHPEYCNYFSKVVRCCHLVDIAVKGREDFGRAQFISALRQITRGGEPGTGNGRPVAIVYGENDPIVGPSDNIRALRTELDTGQIPKKKLHLVRTSVTHFMPTDQQCDYPMNIPQHTRWVKDLAEAINAALGLVADLRNLDDDDEKVFQLPKAV
jgi:pimeloyl-ACP methyl ester carboxylesterase